MKSYFLLTFDDSKYGSDEEPKSVLCGLEKEEAYQLKKTLDREYPGYHRVIFDENQWIAWLCRNSY